MKHVACLVFVFSLIAAASCDVSDPARLKIINGIKVTGDDPVLKHTAALGTENGNIQCSAAAIGPNLFMTAAHCVYMRDLSGWTIRAGNIAGDAEILDVDSAITHKNFNRTLLTVENPDTAPNDLAILKTTQSTSFLTPVAIIPDDVRASLTMPFEITIAGYGRTEPNNRDSKGILFKATVLVNNQTPAINEFATHDADGKMGCHGDSGGPAFYKNGDVPVLIGVISRGTTTCDESKAFYTDVAAFRSFTESASKELTNAK